MCGACHLESVQCGAVACIFTSYGDYEVHRLIVENRLDFNLGLWNVRARNWPFEIIYRGILLQK